MYRTRLIAAIVSLAAASTWAVKPAAWTHEQPKDFSTGEAKSVVISSQGEVMLSRDAKVLKDAQKDAEVVNALAQATDGKIYAATGPNGHVYKVSGDDVSLFATLPEGNVFSLVIAKDGRLLAGTGGGEQAKIYAIDAAGKPTLFYAPDDTKYIWAMACGEKGEIYAATGIEGRLFVIDADGKNGKVLADLKPKSLLCMAFGPENMIYVGTDEDGLIYRINPSSGKPYVMYDAAEAEISALVVDEQGNVYASTAAADQARPGRTAADKPGGKPEATKPSTAASKPAGTQPSEEKAASKKEEPKDEGDNDAADEGNEDESSASPRKFSLASILAARGIAKPTAKGAATSASSSSSSGGNAIYRIDTFGFVTEVFREPVIILDMAESNGTIYAATGDEGRIYAIAPQEDRKSMIVKLDSSQVTSLLRLDDGSMVVGTANAPKIVRISEGYAAKGTLIGKPLDASQIVKWGRLKWDAAVPAGTKLTVATRSGNVADEESDAWDEWSSEMDATTGQQIASPGARYLQYRLTFETTKPDQTAKLTRLNIARIEENRPPLVSSLEVITAVEEAKKPTSSPKIKQLGGAMDSDESTTSTPQNYYVVKWECEDPNEDTLMYEVFYRQVGQQRWIRIAKELKESPHIWDSRTVPDGKYELRVLADDRTGNPVGTELKDTRVSDPVLIDNTPPDVRFDKVEQVGKSGARIHGIATDALSPVTEATCYVDSAEVGRTVVPDDDVFDSSEEPFTITLRDLEPGDHWIGVRVTDEHGNVRYVTQAITTGE